MSLDRLAAEVLAPLAVWVFASSLDDFLLDLFFLYFWGRSRFRRRGEAVSRLPPAGLEAQPTIAIFVPCWAEQEVIEKMLEHNLAAIDYENYEIWLGVYPNDLATQAKAASCGARFRRVHYVVCPHDGPTTKADCLNWIYQGLRREEERSGRRYEIILQHDAEDLIHPQSLHLIREQCVRYHMVQVPVFPLKTPLSEATHATYCDLFAEAHVKDLWVRSMLGGFLPSAGVGTAYRRDALEKLEAAKGGVLFDPRSLTEDYVMGLELHRLGCTQTIVHEIGSSVGRPEKREGNFIATRAYFPKRFRAAVRQRARWMTGIALQSWQKFGWQASRGQAYWLWRDRKGLLSHPVSVLANVVFLYGFAGWLWSAWSSIPWVMRGEIAARPWLLYLLAANAAFLVWRQTATAMCVGRIYGWAFAATAPLRAPWANVINCCASFRALTTFLVASFRKREVHWTKTIHAYPTARQRSTSKIRLGAILVSQKAAQPSQVEAALRSRKWGERLGESLVRMRAVSEQKIYEALSLQYGLPLLSLDLDDVDRRALKSLPRKVAGALQVIPFLSDAPERLWLAVCEAPDEETSRTLSRLRRLQIRFALITPTNYRDLEQSVLQLEHEGENVRVSGAVARAPRDEVYQAW
jgi:adsorption protein B